MERSLLVEVEYDKWAKKQITESHDFLSVKNNTLQEVNSVGVISCLRLF